MSESTQPREPEPRQEASQLPGEGREASTVEAKPGGDGNPATLESSQQNASQLGVVAEEAWPGDDAPTIISRPSSGGSGSSQRSAGVINVRGRRLAHFELEEPIGVGGMAAVIRARDTQLDRIVALKILPPEAAADPDQVKRFEQEARAAARLDHDNIARVYYCGEDQGLHFIVFEYVEGENLRDRIARLGRIPVLEAVDYILQVARGLAHAADRGVVHRDIKPSNIIITASGVAKLVDMGLARTVGPSAEELTHSGVTLGTFDYISPEQALDPRLADTRSDIYSLGCTFYHMLTGRPPAPEGTAARKLRFHQSERPVDPRYYNPEIARELLLILGRMMAKEPEQRYQHPRELIADLELVTKQWRHQRAPSPPRETLLRLSSQRHRGRWALGLAVVVLCGIAVASWLEERRWSTPSESIIATAPKDQASSESTSQALGTRTTSVAGPSPSTAPQIFHAKNSLELRQAFTEVEREGKSAVVYLEETDEYDLTSLNLIDDVLLRLKAGQVILEPRGQVRATLRMDLTAVEVAKNSIVFFDLQGGIATLRKLKLVLQVPAGVESATLVRLAGGQLFMQDCEIVVESMSPRPEAKVFHILENSGISTNVQLRQCIVRSTVPLMVMEGQASLTMEDCGLYSTGTAMVIRGHRSLPRDTTSESGAESKSTEVRNRPSLALAHCTWWLDSGPALVLTPGSMARMSLSRCVLAKVRGERPTMMVAVHEEPLTAGPDLRLELDNCVLYRLEPFMVRQTADAEGSETLLASLRNWQSNNLAIKEENCLVLEAPPWSGSDPVEALEQGKGVEAFRLRVEAAELRHHEQPDMMLGVRRLLAEPLYTTLPKPSTSLNKPGVRELIVDGTGGKPNTFDSLSSALNSSVAEGENRIVITLRVNGVMPIRSLLDIVGNRHVTIRAAEGFQPELAFHAERVPESNAIASLFRVHDGQLVLEQLGFRLSPLMAGSARWQAVVNVTGSGSCTLRQCHVSFVDQEDETQLALVAVTDPTGTMAPHPGKPGRSGESPQLHLENCVLRGRGVGVYEAESRPLRLSLQNVLAVLEAPLLRVETSRTEMSALGGGEILCNLERVSVCTTEPVVHLSAVKENAQPVPVRWLASHCLFVVQGVTEQALLRIEGPQNEQEIRRTWFSWSGQADKPNVCSVNGPALVWRSLGQQAMMSALTPDRTEWSNFWGTNSEEIRFVRQWRWLSYRPGEKPTWEVLPQELQIPPGILPAPFADVGADLARLPLYKSASAEPERTKE